MYREWLGKVKAISEADMEESLRHAYDMGAATVRLTHYHHDPRRPGNLNALPSKAE